MQAIAMGLMFPHQVNNLAFHNFSLAMKRGQFRSTFPLDGGEFPWQLEVDLILISRASSIYPIILNLRVQTSACCRVGIQ